MSDASLFSLLLLAFSVGMVHALDADHVMAVATLSGNKNKLLGILKYSAKWGLGHGGVLIFAGLMFLLWGVQFSASTIQVAETSVGILLCGLGLALLWSIKRNNLRLVRHSHSDMTHTHLVFLADPAVADASHNKRILFLKHDHAPVVVGFIHGLAGSAPIVAILPSLMLKNHLFAFCYLLLFSFGCLIGMVCFGFLFAKTQFYISQMGQKIVIIFRGLLASASVVIGCYWLIHA